MQVEKEVAAELRDRTDLIQLLDASADYLASRDKDASSQTRARWSLWTGPNSEPVFQLHLFAKESATTYTLTISPKQLVPTDIQRLRLSEVWTDFNFQRARTGMNRVNELMAQYQREHNGDQN